MKKLVVTILAIFYLGVSSGATVHLHFCMGKLINWSIVPDEADDCSNCGMEKGNSADCCKEQQYKITVKDSPKASSIAYSFQTPGVLISPEVYGDARFLFGKPLEENVINGNSPPRTQAIPAFIRNCAFRI